MLTFKQFQDAIFLSEAYHSTLPNGTEVFSEPSSSELEKIKRSAGRNREVRGLVHPETKKVLVWDSSRAEHYDVLDHLQQPKDENRSNHFMIYQSGGKDHWSLYHPGLKNHPWIAKHSKGDAEVFGEHPKGMPSGA